MLKETKDILLGN